MSRGYLVWNASFTGETSVMLLSTVLKTADLVLTDVNINILF